MDSRLLFLALAFVVLLVVAAAGVVFLGFFSFTTITPAPPPVVTVGPAIGGDGNTVTVERTEYTPPPAPADDVLTDDRVEDKQPVAFDPALVDRRPLGQGDAWRVNASAAVLRMHAPMIFPDSEADLLVLHSSYAAAIKGRANVLPSVNLLDGKAKQFDDGLYAALDQAYYQGREKVLVSHVALVRRLFDRVGKDGPAAAYLAAGLELAGVKVDVTDVAAKEGRLDAFLRNEVRSKPIGFYTWNETLAACFRFLRYFQAPFPEEQLPIAFTLAKAMEEDKALLADYRKAMAFYAKLTNPYRKLTIADLTADGGKKQPKGDDVALFPGSTSKEVVLFEKLFPLGLPPGADLMRELISAIRSGKVDLTPTAESGWYDRQAFALETLLLPEKGQEKDKLVLTKEYKKRMREAFQALVTKRRETHVRQLEFPAPKSAEPPPPVNKVKPRLRVEPNPTYYLRTARAYAFLATFLDAAIGPEALRQLRGLKEGGQRDRDLRTELQEMRDLFYGLYLVSAEDIGLKPAFTAEETVDQERCYALATAWLPKAFGDPDLAVDTRVSVPIYVTPGRGVRLWTTLGVRLAKLDVSYVKPPSLKPTQGEGAWQAVEPHRLEAAHYLIPVDEFAEVEIKGMRVLTRDELRAVCDREKTKEKIVAALQQ